MSYFRFSICVLVFCFLIGCKGSKTSPSKEKKTKDNQTHVKTYQGNEKAAKVISAARSYIGTPYKFGGTSRAGLDCSGLMLLSFKEVNVDLPRTSAQQSNIGTAVKFSDLIPGDLVFFTDKKGGSNVTHVGIVSSVKGPRDVKFIHSSTKLGVVENDLYVSYYESILIKARRVL